jgi:hypothetical protein
VKARFAPVAHSRQPPLSAVGTALHQAIADEMATWL